MHFSTDSGILWLLPYQTEITMAFGFPAYHTENLAGTPDAELRGAITQAMRTLGWSIRNESEHEIKASTSINLASMGEQILVQFTDQGVMVKSQCAMPTQCFDWGKNKTNVQKLFTELSKHS